MSSASENALNLLFSLLEVKTILLLEWYKSIIVKIEITQSV